MPFKSRVEKLLLAKQNEIKNATGATGDIRPLIDTFFEKIEAKENLNEEDYQEYMVKCFEFNISNAIADG